MREQRIDSRFGPLDSPIAGLAVVAEQNQNDLVEVDRSVVDDIALAPSL